MGSIRILLSLLLSLCMVMTSFASTVPQTALEEITKFQTFGEIVTLFEKYRSDDVAYLKEVMKEQQLTLDTKLPKFSVKGNKVSFTNGYEAVIEDNTYSVTHKGITHSFNSSQSLKEVLSQVELKTSFSPVDLILPSAHANIILGGIGVYLIIHVIAGLLKYSNSVKIKEATKLSSQVCSNHSKVQVPNMNEVKEGHKELSDLNIRYCLSLHAERQDRVEACTELKKVMTCFQDLMARAPAVDSSGRDISKDNISTPPSDTHQVNTKATKQ